MQNPELTQVGSGSQEGEGGIMGGGKGSKAPDPPDYAAQARAQGAADKATAQYTTALDRPNQYAPNGSSEWVLRPGADADNPMPGDWTQTTSLSPEQQAIYAVPQQRSEE